MTPDLLLKAEKLWREGMSGEAIGGGLGVTGAAICYQAAKRGWPRHGAGGATPAAKKGVHMRDPGYVPSP